MKQGGRCPPHLVNHIDCSLFVQDAMSRYLHNHQQVDGGWGTHIGTWCCETCTVTCVVNVCVCL